MDLVTVSGSVADGAIGKIERFNPNTRVPVTDIVNPNGNWTIQQWMSNSFKLTGDKTPDRLIWGGEATTPDGPNEKYRRVENNAFVYSDFPGLKKKSESAGNLTYGEAEYDFDIKLIDGSRQCEVSFMSVSRFKTESLPYIGEPDLKIEVQHVQQNLNNPTWNIAITGGCPITVTKAGRMKDLK